MATGASVAMRPVALLEITADSPAIWGPYPRMWTPLSGGSAGYSGSLISTRTLSPSMRTRPARASQFVPCDRHLLPPSLVGEAPSTPQSTVPMRFGAITAMDGSCRHEIPRQSSRGQHQITGGLLRGTRYRHHNDLSEM